MLSLLAQVPAVVTADEGGAKFAAWQFGVFAGIVLLGLLIAVEVVLRSGRPRD